MILPYEELKEKIIQITNLTHENMTTYGLSPIYMKRTPAFIMPNKTIVYVPIKHISAEFFTDIEICLNLVKNIKDKQLLKQQIEELRKNIVNDYYRLKKDREEITPSDVQKYLNLENQQYLLSNPTIKNLFSEELHSILISSIKSRRQIYDYFLYLVNKSDNIMGSLLTYPNSLIKNILQEPENNQFNHDTYLKFMQDFIIDSAGVDKSEIQRKNTITTTRLNPNEFYFNYKIMDYSIVQRTPIKFDEKSQTFREIYGYNIESQDDKKYEEEIELIKKLVPYKDRPKYFL